MSANNPGNFPLVSGEVFNALQADLEDAEIARRYLMQYLEMWDGRYTRLSAAIRVGNRCAAMDAVLSVRTSARMVGALRLTALAARIEQHLAAGESGRAIQLLDELETCGRLTMEELRRRFLPRFGPDRPDSLRHNRQNPNAGPGDNGRLHRLDGILTSLAAFTGWEPRLN